MAHVAFRPFEAPLTDMTETFSLVANMILLVSVPVYRILQSDHADTRRAGRVVSVMEMLAVVLIIAVCVVGGYAQLHIFRVVADPSDGDGPAGEPKDDADLGDMEMREDESRISYKQRMLQRRLEQKQAEAAVLRQGVESYRAYQEHELREVRSAPGFAARVARVLTVSGAGEARTCTAYRMDWPDRGKSLLDWQRAGLRDQLGR